MYFKILNVLSNKFYHNHGMDNIVLAIADITILKISF